MTTAPEDKRIIVVTGGSRGIGRAICTAFAGPDSRIYFNYSSGSRAFEDTEQSVQKAGGTAIGMRADITSESAVSDFFKSVLSETGRIDVLINNAGITRDALLVRMKASDWDAVMEVNLKGVCRRLNDLTSPRLREILQNAKCSEIGAIGGNLGVLEPCAVDCKKQVILETYRLVEVSLVDA